MPQVAPIVGTSDQIDVLVIGTNVYRVQLSPTVTARLATLATGQSRLAATVATLSTASSASASVNNRLWLATFNPSAGAGINGDTWLNTAALVIFGPKTASGWGSGFSISTPINSGFWRLTKAATSGTVTGLGLAFVPLITPSVVVPPGSALNPIVNVVDGSETADGFDYTISPAPDDTTYLLGYLLVPRPTLPSLPPSLVVPAGPGGEIPLGPDGSAPGAFDPST